MEANGGRVFDVSLLIYFGLSEILPMYPPGNQHIPPNGKTKIIFKSTLERGYVSPQEGSNLVQKMGFP